MCAGTPYEGGAFELKVELTDEYPLEPPTVTFKTKVFHPNIWCRQNEKFGKICLDVLSEAWSPASTIQKVCDLVQCMMRFWKGFLIRFLGCWESCSCDPGVSPCDVQDLLSSCWFSKYQQKQIGAWHFDSFPVHKSHHAAAVKYDQVLGFSIEDSKFMKHILSVLN